MAVFDLVTCASKEIRAQSDVIDEKYFSVDTADNDTIHSWNDYNRYAFTAAMLGDKLYGFFTVLPIASECAALFESNTLSEEELSLEHVLPHESLRYASYAYIPAIAIHDIKDYRNHQCLAALLVGLSDLFANGYDRKYLRRVYANPTTFEGNRFIRRIGFSPIKGYKKPLTGTDSYYIDVDDAFYERLHKMTEKYRRFVGANPWKNPPQDE